MQFKRPLIKIPRYEVTVSISLPGQIVICVRFRDVFLTLENTLSLVVSIEDKLQLTRYVEQYIKSSLQVLESFCVR
jgi:hypothetical protein